MLVAWEGVKYTKSLIQSVFWELGNVSDSSFPP